MSNEMTNDPDVIRADIERTRGDLSRDVNALGEAVSPRQRREAAGLQGRREGLWGSHEREGARDGNS